MRNLLERVRAQLEQLWDCTCTGCYDSCSDGCNCEYATCERCEMLDELDRAIASV